MAAGKQTETVRKFFSKEDEAKIISAIQRAETKSSSEFVVHLIKKMKEKSIILEAERKFFQLGLDKAENKNAVLILLAIKAHQFAIIGDAGINSKVATDYWTKISTQMAHFFKVSQFAEGIEHALNVVGEEMAKHYPRSVNDINEFSDTISSD